MTDAEWKTCQNVLRMFRCLGDRPGERKFRLFAVACCRHAWPLLTDEHSRQAVEVAERFADAGATREELLAAWEAAVAASSTRWEENSPRSEDVPANAAAWCAYGEDRVRNCAGFAAYGACWFLRRRDRRFHAHCLRCILGNPFRPFVIDPAMLGWRGGIIPRIAQAIYAERGFDRLPILADALEEAGCADTDVLHHCRRPGEHARGCWVVDAVLGMC